jgi:SEC-C motif
MLPFDVLFPQLASEYRMLRTRGDPSLPDGQFVFRELYCTDRGCDCRRVLLQIMSDERREVVATISYGFEASERPFDDEPRVMLDPLNTQSDLSDTLQDRFESMLREDANYHDELVRHYTMWKAVVEDPSHPDHPKVRNESHNDPAFRPAFARREPFRRDKPKVGPNQPCPCGSGKKLKKCCRV